MNVDPYTARDGFELAAWADGALEEGMVCMFPTEGRMRVAVVPWAADLVVYAIHPNKNVRASLAFEALRAAHHQSIQEQEGES